MIEFNAEHRVPQGRAVDDMMYQDLSAKVANGFESTGSQAEGVRNVMLLAQPCAIERPTCKQQP
jgi:hypothetical protein